MHKHLKTHSSTEVTKKVQADYWNNLISDTFTSLEASPDNKEAFNGKLQKATLDELSIAEASSDNHKPPPGMGHPE